MTFFYRSLSPKSVSTVSRDGEFGLSTPECVIPPYNHLFDLCRL